MGDRLGTPGAVGFEHTRSRLITEVKHRRAWIVLGWGTAWELPVP